MIYWIVFFSVTVLSLSQYFKNSKNFSIFFLYFIGFFLISFVGFRYESVDYYSYFTIWDNIEFDDFGFPIFKGSGGISGKEFIFATVISLFKSLGFSFELFIFLVASLSVGIKFYFYKKLSPYFLLSILLYLSMGFSKDLGQIRNALAAAILLFGLRPLVERSFLKFFLVTLIASGVQIFAISALFAYWLYPVVKNRRYLPYFILLISFSASFFNGIASRLVHIITIFPGPIANKVLGYYSNAGLLYYNPLNISFLLFGLIFLRYRKFIFAQNEYLIGLVVYHLFSLCIYFLFFDFPIISSRIFNLLSFNSVVILLSVLVGLFHGVSRVAYLFVAFLYATLLFYANLGVMADYKNILF